MQKTHKPNHLTEAPNNRSSHLDILDSRFIPGPRCVEGVRHRILPDVLVEHRFIRPDVVKVLRPVEPMGFSTGAVPREREIFCVLAVGRLRIVAEQRKALAFCCDGLRTSSPVSPAGPCVTLAMLTQAFRSM